MAFSARSGSERLNRAVLPTGLNFGQQCWRTHKPEYSMPLPNRLKESALIYPKRMRLVITALVLLGAARTEMAQSSIETFKLIPNAHKLLVVTTPNWNNVQGELTRYEPRNGRWQQVGEAISIVVGRSGLAWDPRLAEPDSGIYRGPVKHEGDGRSPAGVFQLKNAFGFEVSLPGSDNYLPLTSTTECVDDTASRHYAQIVDRQRVDVVDWNSSEKMREVAGYRLGVVVSYNMDSTVKGNGSCIFLHQWSGPSSGTAGCTAMSPDDIETLVRWLAGDEHALIVQLPKPEYRRLRESWRLP